MEIMSPGSIRERIEYHLNELASLRRVLNSRAPISKLPPELLAYILSFCFPDYLSWPPDNYHSKPFKMFLGYTQVYSKWRISALEMPSLWTIVPCGSRARTAKVLERAKGALLSIRLDKTIFQSNRDVVGDVLKDMSRISLLDVICAPKDMSFLQAFLAKPCSNLGILSLNIHDQYRRKQEEQFLLLGGNAPQLRKLSLVYCIDLLPGLCAPSLRHLSLHGNTNASITVVELAKALTNMSALETAHLSVASSNTMSEDVETALPAVKLPSLKFLTADGNGPYLVSFLLVLDAPALISLTLTVTTLDYASYERLFHTQPVLTVLASYSGQISSVEISGQSSVSDMCSQPAFTVRPEQKLERLDYHGGLSTMLRICMSGSSQGPRFASLLLQIASKIKTQALVVSLGEMRVHKATWLGLFGRAQPSSLRVEGTGPASGLIDALGSKVTITTKSRNTQKMVDKQVFFFARLEDLWLAEVDFTTPQGETPRDLLTILKAHLKARPRISRELNLHISDCTGFREDDQAELEEEGWVGTIDWDGSTGDTEDEDDDEYEGCGEFGCRNCGGGGVYSDSDSDY
jgi:hypothetical protein